MIRFYLKIENSIFGRYLLQVITAIVVIFNLLIRIFPQKFIHISMMPEAAEFRFKVPDELYMYCDVFLLLIFIVFIFFTLGIDFSNSMEEIALVVGGSRTNRFMLKKLSSMLVLYICLYLISFFNIYFVYKSILPHKMVMIPIIEVLFYSLVTNFFILSLSLFILFISRDIAISVSLITAYYLIEEALWRCKIMQTSGILGHIYQYYDYEKGGLLKVKIVYIIFSILLLALTWKISQRKSVYKLKFKKFF